MATDRFDEAEQRLDDADTYASYVRWVPQLGARAQRDLATRRAALHYWKKDYASVLPRDTDPVGAVDNTNVDLQLVVANAAFRNAQRGITDKAVQLQALDEAIGSYMAVLKNDSWNADAAFNYEYVAKTRDMIAKGTPRLKPEKDPTDQLAMDLPPGTTVHGRHGAPPVTMSMEDFKTISPMRFDEREDQAQPGRGAVQKRRG